jgi:hypothetical protein
MAAVAVVFVAEFLASNRFGVLAADAQPAAYATGSPRAMLENALTYVGWLVPVPLPWVQRFSDTIEPSRFPLAVVAIAVWAVGTRSAALRERGWIAAGVSGIAMIAPVLPLAHHTYHYYLTPALPAIAVLLGAAADAAWSALGRRPSVARRAVVAATMALSAAIALNGALLVRKIERMPFAIEGLRADPTVDRALIATRIESGLRERELAPGTRLAFWSPVSQAAGPPGAYAMRNVRAALLDGLAVRVMVPAVDSVAFVDAFDGRDHPWQWAVYLPDGRVRVGDAEALERALTTRDSAATTPPR